MSDRIEISVMSHSTGCVIKGLFLSCACVVTCWFSDLNLSTAALSVLCAGLIISCLPWWSTRCVVFGVTASPHWCSSVLLFVPGGISHILLSSCINSRSSRFYSITSVSQPLQSFPRWLHLSPHSISDLFIQNRWYCLRSGIVMFTVVMEISLMTRSTQNAE